MFCGNFRNDSKEQKCYRTKKGIPYDRKQSSLLISGKVSRSYVSLSVNKGLSATLTGVTSRVKPSSETGLRTTCKTQRTTVFRVQRVLCTLPNVNPSRNASSAQSDAQM
ncbi:hypothetical protein KP79_PYT21116 [Mizuhopecten yessoensis]|uniref:Uncharacterized protein n=1 Tax=Mizuhopecten yessoensis TaxID=6573 RepID=A0A210Q5P5_MIZYE|nr:hypothetical protein KP79_PYT21116 [Mizuhopecten yessoensis]